MNDAIALLAISQLVCIGAILYLYIQLQSVRQPGPARRRPASPRVRHIAPPADAPSPAAARAAHHAYAASTPQSPPAAALATPPGISVTDLARRMRKSEEEVRLLLRRQGISG